MNDTFLTYNFKKPDYVKENKTQFSEFTDLPYPVLETTQQTEQKDYNKIDQKVVDKIPEKVEEKVLPTIPIKSTPLPKKSTPSKKMTMSEFKKQLMGDAERVAAKLQVDPNVILAQAFLESGGDTSKTLFGIKAQKGYKGKSQVYGTSEHIDGKDIRINDAFRKYDSISESFDDYANLISGRRYRAAIGKSPLEYYTTIKNSGYATAPHYVDSLMKTYNQMVKT